MSNAIGGVLDQHVHPRSLIRSNNIGETTCFIKAGSECPDQTVRMRRLIRSYTVCIFLKALTRATLDISANASAQTNE